ncbi:Conserved_hypothetical protein [Hexamita inflata]|uniref:Uncharacterized protein n=1 Tax=Hexamita inflata TaxID=28002 RepID=A0AA86PLE7_9EUKA|nr:Conserved hypothetical protein [Hexamita inflata]
MFEQYFTEQQLIQNLTLHLNDVSNILQKQTELIDQQQNTINNLTKNINCTSNYGYSMINGSCIQVNCEISGQQSINGICQCTNINSIIQAGSCICPENSNVIGTSCVCSISGQTMQNGQCACSTTGAFVGNNVCTCGVNSLNVSNTCSCPNGANLLNGVCTCSNINSYVSGNQCVCPTYSLLIGNTCTCPSNSQIVNNQCVCNIITGQIMNNGVCQCQTVNAFVNNGACTCGQDSLNVSNTCQCPVNSSLVNKICTCDKIIGQQMVNGMCQCPSGQNIVNESCKQTSYVINITNFECSQEIFTQTFDIQSITNQLNSSNNFSSGYVFSASNVIQNAFVDISDNIYTSTVYPLFQSQNTFYNLKIQFGTQSLNGGSFIISSCISISINQMNVVSRSGSQLTLNTAKLNILTSSLSTANINNLLVNLSFSPSYGNITLISDINGVFNITGYQVLGSYVSSQTVVMICININTATVKVNQVNFKPTTFTVGNSSSYLFGNAVTTSTILINNFVVIIGNSSNFQLLGSIYTSIASSYQFGGVISCINSNSILSVNNIILDSYQQFSTSYVSYSGVLVGKNMQSNSSSITIINLCLQQNITSNTTKYDNFGLIGSNIGNISVQNVSVSLSVQGSLFWSFGIIGYQYTNSINVMVINLKTSVNIVSSGYGDNIGSLIGVEMANNCSIFNVSVVGENIRFSSSSEEAGGFIGHQCYNATIMNCLIQQTNISGSNYVGGFVGYVNGQLYLINSKIQLVRLTGTYVGIVAGQGSVYFTSSSSTNNYVNGVLQHDCVVLSNFKIGCE